MSSSGQSQKPSVARTCNLLSQYLKDNGRFGASRGAETMNLLPNLGNYAEVPRQNIVKASDLPAASSPMTIFYGGKMFVFNDFAAEKAKEIMGLAIKASSSPPPSSASSNVSNVGSNNNKNIAAVPVPVPDCCHQPGSTQTLPIARRASLHRFFEKRKDRAIARAPYQVNSPSPMASAAKKEDQIKYSSWLELQGHHHQSSSSSSQQLIDLNL